MARQKDYFSFESIRDREGNVVCYHVTMIGTIEADGVARMRTDFGADENQRMAFGRLTVCGLDKKIKVFTDQLNCRIYCRISLHNKTPFLYLSLSYKYII